jgi:two-component system, NtrC family, sensor kinase
MWQEQIRRYALPGSVEKDPGFRKEIERISQIGLKVVAGAEIIVSAFMTLSYMLLQPDPELVSLRLMLASSIITVGLLTLGASRAKQLRKYARPIGAVSGLLTAAVLVWFLLMMTAFDPTSDDTIPGQITLVTLVAVAALPLRPTDTLLFGFGMECTYVVLSLTAQELMNVGAGVDPLTVLYIFMLSCLAAALTGLMYGQRRSTYEWHVSTLHAAEDLRLASARNLLSQNAASVGRLAAALSHELNSPIGALVSGVDTLLLLAARQATSEPSQQQRLVVLQNELRKSIKQSTDRLKEIVLRMQRFTNLDKAEVQSADINNILGDVAALIEPRYEGKAKVEMNLQPVPPLVCRPQQLSAVFSNLLGNAIEATNGTGRVVVSTQKKDSLVEVAIADNGRGLEPAELETIFDPGFKVTQGRVTTGNWSMFSSLQIIREHGGDIHIFSKPGQGTTVNVHIPVEGAPAGLSLT